MSRKKDVLYAGVLIIIIALGSLGAAHSVYAVEVEAKPVVQEAVAGEEPIIAHTVMQRASEGERDIREDIPIAEPIDYDPEEPAPVVVEDISPGPVIGGDRDEHGCLGPAGYTWCEAKQKCLRTWEEECPLASAPGPMNAESETIGMDGAHIKATMGPMEAISGFFHWLFSLF